VSEREALIALDRARVWHPYSVAGAGDDPIVVARATGACFWDVDGRRYLDGNASWWTAALGHGHPRLVRALARQAETLAHVAFAGTTHEPAARLADELLAVAPRGGVEAGRAPLSRVFFSDNGSTSVEVAVKMALQMWSQTGRPEKRRFVALDGAFHGDTLGATALGGVELFRRPFAGVLMECARAPFPDDAGYAQAFAAIAELVVSGASTLAGVVVEPVVQGAAGMRMYHARYLRELRALCDAHDVLMIVDEVFTGYGRTGPMWACQHADVTPDLLCVGKVFASFLPMAATLVTERVHDAFCGSADRALMYGHTFCANPLGAAVAREVLAVYRDEDILGQVAAKAPRVRDAFARLAETPGVARVRSLGMIGAADLGDAAGYLGGAGWRVYAEARKRGAYLRPLGDTVYVCPPLTIGDAELDELLGILHESVGAAL